MKRKLKCVIVDDEPNAHQTIVEHLKNSPIGEVIYSFYKPSDFLKKMNEIDFDVVFLDIQFNNDTLHGFHVAAELVVENKIFIFISGHHRLILEACKHAGAIDVVPKPNTKEKLNSALIKASKIILNTAELPKKEHELFYVAERKEQVSILLTDIFYIKTAERDHRNKEVIVRNGKKMTLMNCTFGQLINLSPKLVQINISELISYDIVDSIFHDIINVKADSPIEIPRTLTLSKTHRKGFKINFI